VPADALDAFLHSSTTPHHTPISSTLTTLRKRVTYRQAKTLAMRDLAFHYSFTPRWCKEDDIPSLNTAAFTMSIDPSDSPPWMSTMEQ